jgi:hypothetical protein
MLGPLNQRMKRSLSISTTVTTSITTARGWRETMPSHSSSLLPFRLTRRLPDEGQRNWLVR